MTITCNKPSKQFESANCKLNSFKSKYLQIVEQIMEKKNKVYLGYDVLDAPIGYKKYASTFYHNMAKLSQYTGSNFNEFPLESSIWTSLGYKVQEQNNSKIMDQIYKQKISYEYMQEKTSKILVNEVMVVCFNLFCVQPQKAGGNKRGMFSQFTRQFNTKDKPESFSKKPEVRMNEFYDIQLPNKETVDFIEELNEVMQMHSYKLYAQFSQILMHKNLFSEFYI